MVRVATNERKRYERCDELGGSATFGPITRFARPRQLPIWKESTAVESNRQRPQEASPTLVRKRIRHEAQLWYALRSFCGLWVIGRVYLVRNGDGWANLWSDDMGLGADFGMPIFCCL